MDVYFIVWLIIHYYFSFLLKFFQFWPLGDLLVDSSVPLTDSHYSVFVCVRVCFFRTSLLTGAISHSKFFLYISCPRPRITHFSEELLLLSFFSEAIWLLSFSCHWRMLFKNTHLGSKCACYYH